MYINNLDLIMNDDKFNELTKDTETLNKLELLVIGGSRSYGLNSDDSDIDIRGFMANTRGEILGCLKLKNINFLNDEIDVEILNFNKFAEFMIRSNPYVLFTLGSKDKDIIYCTDIGKKILDNKELFITENCTKTFGGLIRQQTLEIEKMKNKKEKLLNDKFKDEKEYKDKLNKLYCNLFLNIMIAVDLFKSKEINTYRNEEERKFLLEVKNNEYDEETLEGYFDEYYDCFEYFRDNNNLKPIDMKAVNKFLIEVREMFLDKYN